MRPVLTARGLTAVVLTVCLSATVGSAQASKQDAKAKRPKPALVAKKPFARTAGTAGLRRVTTRERASLASRLTARGTAPIVSTSERPLTLVHLDSLVSSARELLGVRYVWAGSSIKGVDCSGLVRYAFAKLGLRVPHNAAEIARSGEAVDPDTAKMLPGDLIVFSANRSTRISHVGMYVGDGVMVHASTSQRRVIEVPFANVRGLKVRGVRRMIALGDSLERAPD